MLTLYYAPGSSSMAPHIALEEAAADYEAKSIDEDAGEQRSEAYLRINPRGKVPALRLADGTVLVENIAIQTYIARTHRAAKLLPHDPVGEARALSVMSFFASAVHPAFAHFWRPGRYTDEPSAEAGIRGIMYLAQQIQPVGGNKSSIGSRAGLRRTAIVMPSAISA
jgi:glutathione S-transferase